MKLLLDTNILIDFAIQREPYYGDARKLMLLGCLKELELWVGSSQISDLIYAITEGGKPKFKDQAQDLFAKLFQFVHIYATDEDDCKFMANSNWSDLEDCLVFRNASAINADGIVTRDASGFIKSNIDVYNYRELFEHIKSNSGFDYELIEI